MQAATMNEPTAAKPVTKLSAQDMEALGMRTMIEEYTAASADAVLPEQGNGPTQRYFRRYAIRLEQAPDVGDEMACRKGCSYCCHTRVAAPPQEVLVLVEAIERMSPELRTEVAARLAGNVERMSSPDAATNSSASQPCAFLGDGGDCSVYEDRPSNCRRYHSLSLKDCESSFAQPENQKSTIRLSTPQLVVSVSQYLGYRKLLEQRGLDTAFYELNSALHEALEDPQACRERYAQGQPAFTRATVTVSHGSLI